MNPKHGQPWPKKNANKNVTKKPFYTYRVTKKKIKPEQPTLWTDLWENRHTRHTSGNVNGATINAGEFGNIGKIT